MQDQAKPAQISATEPPVKTGQALPSAPAAEPLKQPVALEEPQSGGSYLRDPITGALSRA